tara:strand:+ start:227 stop:1144 length:918 start_codon:yes stop_codon:yes gene_type:complete
MVNLIIHPGIVKSGTTFFQEIILPKLKKTINLGKPYKSKINIKKILYSNKKKLNKNEIVNFVNVIIKKVKKEKTKNIIISDESIFDYEFYNPEKNIKFLKKLILEIKKKLNIKIIFILTIRKQDALLISRYAYLYPKFKKKYPNFTEYINAKDKNKKKFFDLLHFYKTSRNLKKIYNCKVVFLPIEYLEFAPKKYLLIINKIFNSKIIQKNLFKKKVNKNSEKNFHFLRSGNLWFNIYNYLYSSSNIRKLTNKLNNNLIHDFTKKIIYKNIKFSKSKKSYFLEENIKKKINKIYYMDNKKLKFYI